MKRLKSNLFFVALLQLSCFFLYFPNLLISQTANEDSLKFLKQINDLSSKKQYASIQYLLENRLKEVGLKPYWACRMVQNGLKNYTSHQLYKIFYLRNEAIPNKVSQADTVLNIQMTQLRNPQRILRKIINSYPNYAWTYKLLGDYYQIQLQEFKNFDFASENLVVSLEEKVFNNYSKAVKLGYISIEMNRWLGIYYLTKNQYDQAESCFLKNITDKIEDPVSLLKLSEISYSKKEFSRAYNFAERAMEKFPKDKIYQLYEAKRLAANSLKELGELTKFQAYLKECIHSLPEIQDAYIDLINYYISDGNTQEAESTIRNMLLHNPYEKKGFRTIEKYILDSKNFYFADTLFDEMLMQFENWDEVLANIYWSKGDLAYNQGLETEAHKYWEISRNYMRHYLPEDSELIKEVGQIENKQSN
ncbi:MAG: hypothetical protein P8Y60_03280 [Calditrichota bacterium]